MRYIKVLLFLLVLLNYCNNLTSREQEFIEKHGFEDYSRFKGCHLFYRGTNKEKGAIVAGYIPIRQGENNLICFINVFIKDKDNCELVHDSKSKNVDTVFIFSLVEDFLEFQVSELQVDTIGNVSIALCEDRTTLFLFVNEEELLLRNQTKWKKIEGNWYKPEE